MCSCGGSKPKPPNSNPPNPPGCTPNPCPPITEYHMHVDANRDGSVDDDRTGIDSWEWGAGKKGAIILCNNDDDDGASSSDNRDDKINGGNDSSADIAPLEFRRIGPPPPPGWELFLEVPVANAGHIRIFDSRFAGAKEIIGPAKGNKYKFPDLNFTKKEFGMEAIHYADGSFDGEITLTFTVNKTGGGGYSENAAVRVSPWIMPNHLDSAIKVFVVDAAAENSRFRSDLKTMVTAAGCAFQEHAETSDPWMQDCMEFGYSNLPGAGYQAVMRAPRNRPLKSFPVTLRKADLGYHEQGSLVPAIPLIRLEIWSARRQ